MLFLVRLSVPFLLVTILCGAIMVVKAEPPECVYSQNESVVECKKVHNLNDLQGAIKENTKVLMLRSANALSRNLATFLENAEKVKTLQIIDNKETIKPHALSVFSNLKVIELRTSHWDLIKTGTFSGLTQLKILYLNSGHIKELQNSAFEDAMNLEELYLPDNQLLSIPSKAFSGLSNLEILSLSKNSIRFLSATVFRDLTSLTTLDLSENDLEAIQADWFNPLRKLENLALMDNHIAKISGQFQLPQLKMLSLANNVLSELPNGLLEGCGSLISVDLAGNPSLKYLTEQPFLQLTKLKHLMLGGNNVSAENFVTLKKQSLVIV